MIANDYPVVETGDTAQGLEAWRVSKFTDTNTDRGRIYVESVASGGSVVVSGYRDRGLAAGDLVFQGTGTPGSRLSLAAQNGSRLVASVWLGSNAGAGAHGVVLYVMLASPLDVRERDDRMTDFGLGEDPPEINFEVICKATMRSFLMEFHQRFPPRVAVGRALAITGGSPAIEGGRYGAPDRASESLWTLNVDHEFELVGLQNPGDYREWAICDTLARLWDRKAQGGDDRVTQRANDYRARARWEWERVVPWIDVGLTSSPDRPIATSSVRIRRG